VRWLDGSESEDDGVSSILSSLEVVSGLEVGFSGFSISSDLFPVDQKVLLDSRFKFRFVLEDSSPSCDGLEVVTNGFAG